MASTVIDLTDSPEQRPCKRPWPSPQPMNALVPWDTQSDSDDDDVELVEPQPADEPDLVVQQPAALPCGAADDMADDELLVVGEQ